MGMLGVMAVISLISFFIQPFFSLMQWFAADGDSVGEAVKRGFQAGKNNYGQMLLLAILNFFIIIGGFLLLDRAHRGVSSYASGTGAYVPPVRGP